MISKKLTDAINQQIGNELGASMQYLHIAAYFDSLSLRNLSQFFFLQADEERDHAMKFFNYLLEVGADPVIPAIPEQKAQFGSAEEAVADALKWEEEVTKQIYNLVDISVEDRDYISRNFLDWYVAEQLEEISLMTTLLGMVRQVGEMHLFQLENHVLALREEGGEEAA